MAYKNNNNQKRKKKILSFLLQRESTKMCPHKQILSCRKSKVKRDRNALNGNKGDQSVKEARQSTSAVWSCVRGGDEKRECVAVNTRTKRDGVCLSERGLISRCEPGSSRCFAPTAGPALFTVDKQVGDGMK